MARSLWMPGAVLVLSGSIACAGAGKLSQNIAPVPVAAPALAAPPVSGPPPLFKDAATGIELVFVKGGCYPMGSTFDRGGPEERPAHEVCVGDFYIGKYEVTQGQWKAIMGSNPSHYARCGNSCPVEMVSWIDAQDFVARLNGRSGGEGTSGGTFRLPAEAEWEYAARSGGKHEEYAGATDDVDSIAWYARNAEEPHPVGLKAPNGLGLHDMTGNVWEWTNDWYRADYYSSSPRNDPAGPSAGDLRVLRGGSFANEAFDGRATYRNFLPPDYRGAGKGFRLLRNVPEKTR